MVSETQPLLSAPPSLLRRRMARLRCRPAHNLCIPSKAAVLIILWTIVITTAFAALICFLTINFYTIPHIYSVKVLDGSVTYVMVAALMMFYPLSGFIADVCCGRFKTIIISQTLTTISFILVCIDALMTTNKNIGTSYKFYYLLQGEGVFILILLLLAFFLFSVGVIGYQANFIQFGLDQLLEAPSAYLGLFAHYAIWAFNISYLLVIAAIDIMLYCSTPGYNMNKILRVTVPLLLATAASILLFVSCWKHHWFYKEPGQHNPYKTVCNVLNFARKHKHPLQRSAFTYSDDYMPSRLDFAKERYGGPFTTEEVENVKTLSRILLLLLTLGPVHMLQVPASQYMFPLFGYHVGYGSIETTYYWTRVVQNGLLILLSSNILFPIYIWCIFSAFRRRIPSMFKRLGLGVVLSLLGVISMLTTDIVGHSLSTAASNNQTWSQCMFQVTTYNYTREFHPLNMHWYVLIPSSIFLGIGPLLVTTTTLEFISAQSPQSMKGLLVGIFFALQGFFQLLGFIITLPFSITDSWINNTIPSTISCGFIYFLLTLAVGLISFISFIVAAKRYKYRKRDDENFNQMKVEEVYIRYITQRAKDNSYSNE